MRMKIRTYSDLVKLQTFEDRYKYLKLNGIVGSSTFGFDRWLNQVLYKTTRWKKSRNDVIIRDNALDLGVDGYDIYDKILVHHMNPITIQDVEDNNSIIYDPEYLICTSLKTHNAIHFGDEKQLVETVVVRRKNDTAPWLA
jgi:hypothetical protein